MGSKYDRWLALERQHAETGLELTSEQVAYLEKQNSVFRERHVESTKPSELICQDTFLAGMVNGIGKVYLNSAVDAYNSYAFGFLYTRKQPEAAVALVHPVVCPGGNRRASGKGVLQFYADHWLKLEHVLTDNERESCGTEAHPFELYPALNDRVDHRTTCVRWPHTNGFVERFHQTVQSEFFALVNNGLESPQINGLIWFLISARIVRSGVLE